MIKPFNKKTAVVTGSTQGIGYELCKIYIEKGIENLVIVGRDHNKGKKVEKEFKSKNVNCIFIKADLNEVSHCRKIIKTTVTVLSLERSVAFLASNRTVKLKNYPPSLQCSPLFPRGQRHS